MRTTHRAAIALLCIGLAAPNARAHEPDEDHPKERVTAPVLTERIEPVYPEAAIKAGVGGTVGLELAIDESGVVTEVKVLRSATPELDQAALAAARRFKFRPATRDGKPVPSTVLFDQRFVVRPHLTAEVSAEPAAEAPPPSPPASGYESLVVGRGPTSAAGAQSLRELDFDLRPKTSPNDILRVVPGLVAVQHQGGGKADQLFLRGFDSDHGTDVAIHVDGVPVNLPSHAHGQGFSDLHWLIPEAIERIDVVKGPYDTRYGDFATAGAINLVTRRSFDQSSVQLMLGGFPTRGCNAFPVDCKVVAQQRFVGIAAPKLSSVPKLRPWLAFELARDDGPFDARQTLYRYNLFGKLAYDLSPRTELGLFLSAYGSGWNASGQIPAREVDAGRLGHFGSLDPSEGGESQRQMLHLYLHHKESQHDVTASVYWVRQQLSLWNNFTFFQRDPQNGDLIEQGDARNYAGANLAYHFHARWRSISFRTTLGAQTRYDTGHVDLWASTSQNGDFRKRLMRYVDPGRFHFGSDADVSVLTIAGYAEEDIVWTRWLRTIVGLRADWFGFDVDDKSEMLGAGAPATSGTRQKSLLSPKASIVLSPWRHLDLYLNFGMGFHSNDARVAVQESRLTPDGAIVNVVPRLYGGELGARLTIWRLSFAAALWASYLENETVFSGDGGIFEPSDPSRRFGVDLELRLKILHWLYLDWDFAWAHATAVPTGSVLALAPRIYTTGGLTVKHPKGVRAGFRFRYLGERPAFTGDDTLLTAPLFVADLYGAWRYKWFEASVMVQNLFDATWREAQFGNTSCTREEATRGCTGVPDVHYTPGVPFNLQVQLKAYF
jgi:TonB family protein